MQLKLSKTEKVILAFFLVIVIFSVGVFTFILPEIGKIAESSVDLQNALEEKNTVNNTLAREGTIDGEIQDAITKANSGSENFYAALTSYQADVIVREILTATKMETQALTIQPYTTADLALSSFIDAGVNYPLRDYANFTGAATTEETTTDTKTTDAKDKTDTTTTVTKPVWTDESGNAVEPTKQQLFEYLSTQTQTIGATTITFEVTGTRDNFIKFLDYVKDLPQATYIQTTNIAYTEMTDAVTDADGNTVTAAGTNELSGSDKITAAVTLTFYSVERINQELIDQAEAALAE